VAFRALGIALAMAVLTASTGFASASAQPSPGSKLLSYLWGYRSGLLRPYIDSVSITGGHHVVVSDKSRLTGATAKVRESLHDQPSFTKAAWAICRTAAGGVRTLHLGMVSAVEVWSVEGHLVARC
jgi:hypothetical protein